MPFTAQSGPAAAVGTRFRPIGAAGLVCRWSTRLAGRALATGIGRRATVIAGFVGYVAIRVARTRSTDTAGVGRGTSVVTGNRRRTAIRIVFTGRALRTAVVRRTAIGTAHGRNRTFRPHLTSIVITLARFSGRSVFPVTV